MLSTQTDTKSDATKNAALERTLVLIKPDAVARGLVGEIISRFERRGLMITGMKLLHMDNNLATKLYEPHKGKPFYEPLLKYMTSGPIVAMCLEGHKAVSLVRTMLGATDPSQAAPGTIRGDFAQRVDFNCVHGSDSPASAARELPIFFSDSELTTTTPNSAQWI